MRELKLLARRFDKNFIFILIGRLVQASLSILTVRLMTELLDPAEVGHQYLINSIILWFSLVLINPIGMFVNRHLHEWKFQNKLASVVSELNKYFLIVAILSLPIVFIVRDVFQIGEQISSTQLIVYAVIYIYLSTWFQTLSSFFNLFELQKQFVFLNILSQASGLACSYLLVHFSGATAVSWLVGLLCGQTLSLLIGLLLYKKYISAGQDKDISTEFKTFEILNSRTFHFCYPIAITTLFMWFISQGYRIIVENDLGPEVLASLGVGLGIAASIAAIIESVTTQYLYPSYYASLTNSSPESRKLSWLALWKKSFIIYLPFCFLTIATAPFLVRALTSAKFSNVVPYVMIGALIEFFRQSSNISYIASHAEKKTSKTIKPYLLGAVILITGLFVLKLFSLNSLESILRVLCLSAIATYIYNFRVVQKMINISIDYKFVTKVILICLPMLSCFLLSFAEKSLLEVFLISCLFGLWTVFSIWLLFTKLSKS